MEENRLSKGDYVIKKLQDEIGALSVKIASLEFDNIALQQELESKNKEVTANVDAD